MSHNTLGWRGGFFTPVLAVLLGTVLVLSFLGGAQPTRAQGASNFWTQMPSYPNATSPFEPASCVTYNGYIYCVGGYAGQSILDGSDGQHSEVYYAQIAADGQVGNWQETTSYPEGISFTSCVASSGYIYCVGGYDHTENCYPPGVPSYFQSYCAYDVPDVYFAAIGSSGVGSWTQTTSYPRDISGESCVAIGDYIYCVAGYQWQLENEHSTPETSYAQILGAGGLGPWQNSTDYPDTVNQLSCASAPGNQIYCAGGQTDPNSFSTNYDVSDVFEATVSSDGIGSWVQQPSLPQSVYGLSCVSQANIPSDKAFCISGSTYHTTLLIGSGGGQTTVYYATEQSGLGTWASAPDYPEDPIVSTNTYSNFAGGPACVAPTNGNIYCVDGTQSYFALQHITVDDQQTCQAVGGSWDSNNNRCTIEGGSTVSITIADGASLEVDGVMFVDGYINVGSGGALDVGTTGLLYNYGTITLNPGATLNTIGNGYFENDAGGTLNLFGGALNGAGSGENMGTINVAGLGGVFNDTGSFTNQGGTLLVGYLGYFDNPGTFTNYGEVTVSFGFLENGGTFSTNNLVNNVAGIVENYGTMTLYSAGGYDLVNNGSQGFGGTMDNYGTIINHDKITNTGGGTFTNEGSGTISGDGAVDNEAGSTFVNSGTINEGILLVNGQIGGGTITNYGVMNNYGTFNDVQSQLTNQVGGVLTNEATGTINLAYCNIFDDCNQVYNPGTIINEGVINDSAYFSNPGTLENQGSGTFVVTINDVTCGDYPIGWTWYLGVECSGGGALTLAPGFSVEVPSHVLLNTGIYGQITLQDGAAIKVESAGSFYIEAPLNVYGPGGSIQNAGFMDVTDAGSISNSGQITNTGQVSNGGTIKDYCGSEFIGSVTFGLSPVNVTCVVSLTPSQGPSGTQVQVSASGFGPGDTEASFAFQGEPLGPLCTSAPISGGSASCFFTVPSAPPGTYTVTATGYPDQVHMSGTFTVPTISTTSLVDCQPTPASLGTEVTCSAEVTGSPVYGAPGGTVSFGVSPAPPASLNLPSPADCTLSAVQGSTDQSQCSITFTPGAGSSGSYAVQGTYSGDAQYSSSLGAAPLVVSEPPLMVPVPSVTINPADVGQSVTFTASPSGGSGTFSTYTWTGLPAGCTPSNSSTITCAPESAAGSPFSVSVSVTDSDGGTATSSPLSFTVFADPTVAVTPAGPLTYDAGQPAATLTAAVSYSGDNAVSIEWYSSASPSCSSSSSSTGASGSSFTPDTASPGTTYYCAVVSDSGVSGYQSASNPVGAIVSPVLTASISPSTASIYDDGITNAVFTLMTTGGPGGNSYSWSYDGLTAESGCGPTDATCALTSTSTGTFSVAVTVADSNGGMKTSNTATVTVTKRATSAAVACSPSPGLTGSSVSCTATVTDTSAGTPVTPTGTVTFSSAPIVGSLNLPPSCSLSVTTTAGTASCSASFTPSPGSQAFYTVAVSYGGDPAHDTSGGTGSLVVEQPGTTAQGSSTTAVSGGSASSNQASTTGVEVTISGSSAPAGTNVTITTEDLSSPSASVSVNGLLGSKYYDVSIIGITSGTAEVCVTSSSPVTQLQYWDGSAWVDAGGISVTGDTICGGMPVSALTGTNVAIGDPRDTSTTLACTSVSLGASPPPLPSAVVDCIATVTDTDASPVLPAGQVTFAITSPSAPPGSLNFPTTATCILSGVAGSSSEAQCSLAPFSPASGSEGPYVVLASYQGDVFHSGSSGTSAFSVYDTCAQVKSGGQNLKGADLEYCNLSGYDLSGDNLMGANMQFTDMQNANLKGANLKGANLTGTDANGADFTGANLMGANLSGAIITGDGFRGANLMSSDLSGVIAEHADFTGSNLMKSNMSHGDFNYSNFKGANTKGADISGATFVGAIDAP